MGTVWLTGKYETFGENATKCRIGNAGDMMKGHASLECFPPTYLKSILVLYIHRKHPASQKSHSIFFSPYPDPLLTPLKTTLNPPLSETRPGIIEVLQQGSHCLTTRVGHRQRLAGRQSRKAAQSAPTSRQVLLPLNLVLLRLTPWPISEEFASAVSWPPAIFAAAFDD